MRVFQLFWSVFSNASRLSIDCALLTIIHFVYGQSKSRWLDLGQPQLFCILWCYDTGRYCEINVDECASNPCANNGTCTDLIAGYFCTCPPEYVNYTCATPYCSANDPCSNGGTCHGAGLCSCPTGYTGSISMTASESYSFNTVY